MNNLLAELSERISSGSSQYLTFAVRGKAMAIGINDVKEIIEISSMTRVPMSRPCIRGVINLRGSVVPVVDLGKRLMDQAIELDKRSCIVLVETQQDEQAHLLGMLVDQVHEIIEIEPQKLQKTPQFGTEFRADFIAHMGQTDSGFISVLKLERVLAISDLASQSQNLRAAQNSLITESQSAYS